MRGRQHHSQHAAFFVLAVFFLLLQDSSLGGPDSSAATSSSTVGVEAPPFKLYLPTVSTPPIDLAIAHMEVTQAIQDTFNSVPIIQDRPTIVRIHAKTTASIPTTNISVTLTASRSGQNLGTLILEPSEISRNPSRGDYESTVNFALPQSWLSGGVTLSANVDPANLVDELNEDNNQISSQFSFEFVPPLDLMVVPINYTHEPDGVFYPAPTTDTVSGRIMHLFPLSEVNVSMRAPISFSGNLEDRNDWTRLLIMIVGVKNSDGCTIEHD